MNRVIFAGALLTVCTGGFAKENVRCCEDDLLQFKVDEIACAGGGTVVVPPDEHELRPIELKSGVTLRLEKVGLKVPDVNDRV